MSDLDIMFRAEAPTAELRAFAERQAVVGALALYLDLCDVMRESLRLVPVDTGALRGSRFVTRPDPTASRPVVELGFVAPYARAVHDDLRARHISGVANFLKQPFMAWRSSPRLKARLERLSSEALRQFLSIPTLMPPQGVFKPTKAKSIHRGPGAAGRRRKAESTARGRQEQRALREAHRLANLKPRG